MKILVVVDMQNDFITGTLGTKEAQSIVDKVANEILSPEYDEVFITMDTHDDTNYFNTLEGRHLPVKHCIKNSEGYQLCEAVEKALLNHNVNSYKVPKFHFASNTLAKAIREDIVDCEEPNNEIYIIGLCTDICVIANAILIQNFTVAYGTEIYVIADLCAGTTPEKHEAALQIMNSLHINII